MTDIEFAALLVSRVCHDLVSPIGAVVNGLEILEDERDPAMRADAMKLVACSANQAAARVQFARIAFGAAGSSGAQLDLTEVDRIVRALLKGGKIELDWQVASINWPKDWAKLLMNAVLLAADGLPRGGRMLVTTTSDPTAPGFVVRATGQGARILEDVEKAARGEPNRPVDGRSIQPYLAHRLARGLNAGLTLTMVDNAVEIAAG